MEDESNLSRQAEEIEALLSIYEDSFKIDSESCRTYSISIKENTYDVTLTVTLPCGYPTKSPPSYELAAVTLSREAKQVIYKALDEVYIENVGETVIFQWVEKIRECLLSMKPHKDSTSIRTNEQDKECIEVTSIDHKQKIECPQIYHGDVIVDRKSSFQGHASTVTSVEQVKCVLKKLQENKKIQNATHNIFAYRIQREPVGGSSAAVVQDCEDDGETHAGGRLLHLLQILNQKNTLVVVSRWYGGIQLGPDRFRHINNAARQVLVAAGMVNKSS